MPTTKIATTNSCEEEEAVIIQENCDTPMATPTTTTITTLANAAATTTTKHREEEPAAAAASSKTKTTTTILAAAAGCHKPLFFSRRFQDKRNFSSLPLFVYATSPSTHAHSADGVGVAKEAAAFSQKNEGFELSATHGTSKTDGSCIGHLSQSNGIGNGIGIGLGIGIGIGGVNGSGGNSGHHLGGGGRLRTTDLASGAMECLPMSSSSAHHHPHLMAGAGSVVGAVSASPTATVVVGATYPHHLHHHHHLSHHTPYSNSYGSHHIHSEQTKSLQELQHEVGALLEFRDLVIETFPDLKHKMASMSATPSTPTSSVGAIGGSHSVGGGSSSLATRREWEPGIRMKRKLSHKEPSTSSASAAAPSSGAEASSSSLTRSRSNSHSGKKEPKSGENNNGSVVQDSGFSTETSSSKEGHSASSTNGAMTVAIAANRLSCPESDDELLNLLDVIHRKSNRLREEVEQLQSYERQQGDAQKTGGEGSKGANKDAMTPQQFREQVERLNREDIKQLRKERDRLLDKLAEMEAETLTGRIKAAKMSDQVEELVGVKKDLEEQLKLAMAQKLELSSRVQQLQQQQQQQQQSKSSSSGSQSDYSSQRNFLSSATTVLSNGSRPSSNIIISNNNNTFQPVVLDQPAQEAFHQSSGSDTTLRKQQQQQQQQQQSLGRLDGIVSTPGSRNSKCRTADSKRFAAILLETNVVELQRHLLTLTVQNQVLAQKLDSSSKSKTLLAKRLDKSSEEFEHLRYQLEEKSIELEGTKAQLRLVESRLQSSNSTTNSYLHSSQHDYETNRSSASTTLMLSRRGVSDSVDSASTAMPAPPVTQISTPSMKAMVPLAMDELQQHSSSTESAHEHENQPPRTPNNSTVSPLSKTMINASPLPVGSSTPSSIAARVMSISVGGVSPFEGVTPPPRQNAFRKFGSASKPSKIPLPGSKAAAYFSGKPPTGRPSTAGRSPPSAHNSSSTSYGSKSSLSRSTGNLQSLRRAETSASNHSLSTNTSRSSTSSSIPLATTPYSSGSTGNRSQPMAATTPSPRVLQNSPLPKLKRDTISSRVRHLDSLSRAQQSPDGMKGNPNTNATSIAAQLSSTLRKDLQLSGNGNGTGASYHQHHQYQNHRRSGHSPASNSSGSGVSRRYSSASTGGSGGRAIGRDQGENTTPTSSFGGDSDSGKNLVNPVVEMPNFRVNNQNWQLWQTSSSKGRVQMEPYLPHELHDVSEETAYDSYYTEYTTPDSMDCGSDNLLVTFDYGYSDSIEARADPAAKEDDRGEGADPEYGDGYANVDADAEGAIWFGTPPKEKKDAKLFEVHHVQHKLLDDSLQSLISYDVDDFEEELSDPEPDEEIFYDSIECT
ncbi:serine-rich adhesin for platelets isoform X2 [Drosophila ficusphila]|uniref:serine-rich adhesin for platelets isoform X2 n=1 Tax=Drosophila ficusphila TaxID=30025 RepID=UPI0007E86830|nr:serine-rich adhesin for platelets isoform X2 [Drosophila ficusphila]